LAGRPGLTLVHVVNFPPPLRTPPHPDFMDEVVGRGAVEIRRVPRSSSHDKISAAAQAGALVVDAGLPGTRTTTPFTRSMRSACGDAGRPGIRMMSPSRGTT